MRKRLRRLGARGTLAAGLSVAVLAATTYVAIGNDVFPEGDGGLSGMPSLANAIEVPAPDPVQVPVDVPVSSTLDAARAQVRDLVADRLKEGAVPMPTQVSTLADYLNLPTEQVLDEAVTLLTVKGIGFGEGPTSLTPAQQALILRARTITVAVVTDDGYPFMYTDVPTANFALILQEFMTATAERKLKANAKEAAADDDYPTDATGEMVVPSIAPSAEQTAFANDVLDARADLVNRMRVIGVVLPVEQYLDDPVDYVETLQAVSAELFPKVAASPFFAPPNTPLLKVGG